MAARETPIDAELGVLMKQMGRFAPAFDEIAKGVADGRSGDRKARVDTVVAEIAPLLPLADTPPHLGGYQLPGMQTTTMAAAVHNRKVPDDVLMPVRRLVNTPDATNILPDVIRELQRQGVQNPTGRVAALYIASRLPKIDGTPTMRQLTHRTREIHRLAQEFDRRLGGAVRGMQEEQGLQNAVRAKGRTGLGSGRWRTRKRTRKRIRKKSRKGRTGKSKKGRRGTRERR